ncbi:MAG: hypothetical protein ACE5EG_03695 [Thermoanaerobaculia bacterium]
MSSNDSSSDLDSRIAAIVESTVGRMRDELMDRMQGTESRLRDIAGRLGDSGPAAAVSEVAAAAAAPAGDASSDLFDALAAMDRGGSQQDVLAALLEGVGRFASRSALFLTRSDGAQGWGSYGFEESAGDMQGVLLSYSEGPLATLAEGSGCVVLTADECGDLCSQMGAAPGAEGLLVPFVLRDRLAAALYVDRFADDPPLAWRSLQLLTYVGALAVEGLALRQRDETPTLQVATGEIEAPAVALWEAPAAAVPEPEPEMEPPAVEAEVEPEIEPEAAEPEMAEPEIAEPEVAEPEMAEPEETFAVPPTEVAVEELAEEEAAPEMVTEAMPALEGEPQEVVEEEWAVPAEPIEEPAEEPEPVEVAPAEEPTAPLDELAEPAAETPAEEPPPWAATTGDDLPAVATEPTVEPAETMPPPESPPVAPAGETTEVSPPTDVSGPGWAFTASRAAAEAGDDAQHEEARRLARLLVTEIKLYNEEQVEEGRRGNDIYARLREDIDRSRQIFNERVDDAVRQETDYFHEEMVRILAGGNAEALGL